MNIFTKVSVSLVSLVAAASIFAGCSLSAPSVSAALPQLAEVTAEVGQTIARELRAELAAVKQAPRAVRTIQTASVEISELIGLVLVEASRLPPSENFADTGVAQSSSF